MHGGIHGRATASRLIYMPMVVRCDFCARSATLVDNGTPAPASREQRRAGLPIVLSAWLRHQR